MAAPAKQFKRMPPQFYEGELKKLPPDRMVTFVKGQAKVRCHLHGGGMESNPSLEVVIDKPGKTPGIFHCFSCHAKGLWSDLAEAYAQHGLRKEQEALVPRSGPDNGYVYIPPPDTSARTLPNLDMLMPWPKTLPWRGIPPETMIRYSAKLVLYRGKPTAYLPALVGGECVGAIYAMLQRKDKKTLAYINTPGPWAEDTVLGFDQANTPRMHNRPLWVCEGPRDLLHLRSAGVRAVALIGAAVTRGKMKLIRELDPPFLLRATDADAAGDAASAALKAMAKKASIPTARLKMAEGTDPVDLSLERIRAINQRLIDRLGSDPSC